MHIFAGLLAFILPPLLSVMFYRYASKKIEHWYKLYLFSHPSPHANNDIQINKYIEKRTLPLLALIQLNVALLNLPLVLISFNSTSTTFAFIAFIAKILLISLVSTLLFELPSFLHLSDKTYNFHIDYSIEDTTKNIHDREDLAEWGSIFKDHLEIFNLVINSNDVANPLKIFLSKNFSPSEATTKYLAIKKICERHKVVIEFSDYDETCIESSRLFMLLSVSSFTATITFRDLLLNNKELSEHLLKDIKSRYFGTIVKAIELGDENVMQRIIIRLISDEINRSFDAFFPVMRSTLEAEEENEEIEADYRSELLKSINEDLQNLKIQSNI